MAGLYLTDEYGFLGGVGGSCALCNASKRHTDRPERIVTTNLVTDMEDAPAGVWPEKYMEFCEACINEMGHMVGMISEREKLDHEYTLAEQERTITAQAEELAMLKKEIEAFDVIQRYLKPADPPVQEPVPVVTRGRRS